MVILATYLPIYFQGGKRSGFGRGIQGRNKGRNNVHELRGFAPIGMLEWWKNGIMGFGKMHYWVIGKMHLDREVLKGNCEKLLFNQYSIIPLFPMRGSNSGLKKYTCFNKL